MLNKYSLINNKIKNGNETSILFNITVKENGQNDSKGELFKKDIFMPKGITAAIDENNFTSPPPHIFNCHNIKVMIYVIEYEIIEKKMNLMLPVMIVKIKFETNPKIIRMKFNLFGRKPSLRS